MMNRAVRFLVLTGLLAVLTVAPGYAGAYARVINCSQVVDGFCDQGVDRNGAQMAAFAIVHPPGYDGMQATVIVNVCTSASDPQLVGPTQGAVATWNSLNPVVANCPQCLLPEDPLPMGMFHAESLILHELGHALGLDHPNLLFEDPAVGGMFVHTSFSAAYAGAPTGVLIGADGVRGSRDDFMDDLFGSTAVNIHWFREADNDPFIVDGETIDIDHFSRSTNTMLPPGSTWAANGNYCHGFQLGHSRTQAVMYSVVPTTATFGGITADDANMVKMQGAGEDRLANTPDDYIAQVYWVDDCQQADVEVRFGALPPGVPGSTAVHVVPTFASPPPPLARHFTSVPQGSPPPARIIVTLKSDANWDFGNLVFQDGFETGDTSAWFGGVTEEGLRVFSPEGHPYFCTVPPP